MKSIPLLILSTPSVQKIFEASFKKSLHPRAGWKSTSNRITAKLLDSLIKGSKTLVENIVVLAPNSNRPFENIPCVIEKTVISFVSYSKPADLQHWFTGVVSFKPGKHPFIVASMQKPFYIKWAKRFNSQIRKFHCKRYPVLYRPPETTTREDLARLFATGFTCCVYTGHGRSRGWSGYRGFRWNDIEVEKQYAASGSVISLSCSAFKMERSHIPFAVRWVASGRLNTFCGFSTPVHIQPLIIISNYILDFIAGRKTATVSDLIFYLNQRVGATENEEVIQEWKHFRIAGNPLARLF